MSGLEIIVRHVISSDLPAALLAATGAVSPANSNDDRAWHQPLRAIEDRLRQLETELLAPDMSEVADETINDNAQACISLSEQAMKYNLPGHTMAARAEMFIKTFEALNEMTTTSLASLKQAHAVADGVGFDSNVSLADIILTLAGQVKTLRSAVQDVESARREVDEELERHEARLEETNVEFQRSVAENIGLEREIALLRTELADLRGRVHDQDIEVTFLPPNPAVFHHPGMLAALASSGTASNSPAPDLDVIWTKDRKRVAAELYASSDPYHFPSQIMDRLRQMPGQDMTMTSKGALGVTMAEMGVKRGVLLQAEAQDAGGR